MLIKKVLTLTDGSELSRVALRYAVEICRQFNAELYLLTVMDKVPSYLDAEISHEIFERMEDILKNEVANCSGYCETAGLECKSEVRTGLPYEEIIKYTEEIDADRSSNSWWRIPMTGSRHPCSAMVILLMKLKFLTGRLLEIA